MKVYEMNEINEKNISSFTDVLSEEGELNKSQPISLSSSNESLEQRKFSNFSKPMKYSRPAKYTGQHEDFRSIEEIDEKYRQVFSYPFFNRVQSGVIDDALYTDKSMVVCAPTGSGKTVVFEMVIVKLLMELEDRNYNEDFKIIYIAPVKALCTERLTEWYPKFTRLGLMCIEVTGDTDVDFSQLKPYRIIITTPEKWDMLTRRWKDHRGLVEVIKLFLTDEVHILNDELRGPVLEAVVSRMKTIESSVQSAHRIEHLQRQYQGDGMEAGTAVVAAPRIRFVAVSATVSNPDEVAAWLGTKEQPAVYYKFGDECRPVKLNRVVEGYPCSEGCSIFKFDIILNYKLWPIIQKYYNGKPTLIFCNTRKSVALTAETLSRELTINFKPEQKAKLQALASTIKNKKLQGLVLSGVGCHHAGLLYEERMSIEHAFRNRDLPILITTTTLAMGVNLPAHLVIVKNTQQYVNGAYQEYSISTVLQMIGRAGRPQFDTEATAVIMTRLADKHRYQALVGGSEPLQSYLHKRLAENLNSEAALGTVADVAQCVQWVNSTFLSVRAARDPRRYLGLQPGAPVNLISKKIEELCVKAMNGLATCGLITMDEASCIQSTEAGRLMSIFYLDLETMKLIMKINGSESLDRLLWVICESHELADMHLRVDERRCLNALNRSSTAPSVRYPMKGKINTRQMKLNCIIQATLGCLPIPDPSLNQEAMKIMRVADRICKCLVAYVTRPDLISHQPQFFSAALNSIVLAKCIAAQLWENSPYVSKQLKGIGTTFSTLLATAGKVNFMLLEESHPRDLERVMNKGPPAGNVLRKQISLLPKYQLTMTPIDEKTVEIQLLLLNQAYLAENMEQLTAGENHKSYLIVGDSDNHLLLLTHFKDNDLINIYDGCIKKQITRKHNFEHKLLVHIVSSSFVGIDVQCEYLFKDLEPVPMQLESNNNFNEEVYQKKAKTLQTCITDVYKDRKRKNSSDTEITLSKEKKKRDTALIEKFKLLKESFGATSKELKGNLQKSKEMTEVILQDLTETEKSNLTDGTFTTNKVIQNSENCTKIDHDKEDNLKDVERISFDETFVDDINNDVIMDDERIDLLLKEIESEIGDSSVTVPLSRNSINETRNSNGATKDIKLNSRANTTNTVSNNNLYRRFKPPIIYKNKPTKSNYSFIETLGKNVNLNDTDENLTTNKGSGFSDAIKSGIENYLQNTKNTTSSEKIPSELLQDESELPTVTIQKFDVESHNKPLLENYSSMENENTNKYQSSDTISNKTKYDNNNKNEITSDLKNKQASIYEYALVGLPLLTNVDQITTNHYHFDAKTSDGLENVLVPCGNARLRNINKESAHYSINKELDHRSKNSCNNSVASNTSNEINNKNNFSTSEDIVAYKEILENINHIDELSSVKLYKNNFTDSKTATCNVDDSFSCYKNMSTLKLHNQITSTAVDEIKKHPNYILRNKDVNSKRKIPESAEGPSNNSETEFVKKYSVSGTKVDIYTKNYIDHSLRVIRKVKIDYDLTEIVSKKEAGPDIHDHNFGDISEKENLHNTNDKLDLKAIKESRELDIQTKETDVANYCRNEDAIDTNDTNPENKNTVESILKKYSKILSRKNDESVKPNKCIDTKFENHNSGCTNNKQQVVIPKRPFKISDINAAQDMLNLNSPTGTKIVPLETRVDTVAPLTDDYPYKTLNKIRRLIDTNNEMKDDISNSCGHPIDESLSIEPLAVQSDSCNFTIDNAMFNPKNLLQSLNDDKVEEIVPPPPEFSDFISYSPVDTTKDDFNPIEENEDCVDYIDDNFYTGYHGFNDSVQINSNLDLSKDVETWHLKTDDTAYEDDYEIDDAPAKKSRFQSSSVTSYKPKQAKLGGFKFVRKTQMRM